MTTTSSVRSVLTWNSLIFLLRINVDDILNVTVYRGYDTQDLAEFLDGKFPGILEAWARQCVLTVRPLLQENLPFNENTENVFANPSEYFQMENEDELRTAFADFFSPFVNDHSPAHVIRAMISHIELALGNWVEAAQEVHFALCEKACPDFEFEIKTDTGHDTMIQQERIIAELLIEQIYAFRAK